MSEKQTAAAGDRTNPVDRANPVDPANPGEEKANAANEARDLSAVRDALRGLKFGSVTIFVQDGVIVQVERTEKIRIRRDRPE